MHHNLNFYEFLTIDTVFKLPSNRTHHHLRKFFCFFVLRVDEGKDQNPAVKKSHKRKLKEKNDYHRNDEQVAICLECQR